MLTRLVVALLLIGSAGSSVALAASEGDAEIVEETEDERVEEASEHARLRQSKLGKSQRSSVSKRLDPPQEITSMSRPAPQVTWQLPRRAPPDDGDGTPRAS